MDFDTPVPGKPYEWGLQHAWGGVVSSGCVVPAMPQGEGAMKMTSRRVLVVSGKPLVLQGLKLIIERSGSTEVSTAADESAAADIIRELAPDILVLDREDREDSDEAPSPADEEYPDKVVVINANEDRIVVYCRQQIDSATLANLLGVIGSSDAATGP